MSMVMLVMEGRYRPIAMLPKDAKQIIGDGYAPAV